MGARLRMREAFPKKVIWEQDYKGRENQSKEKEHFTQQKQEYEILWWYEM
jgi:hypothetical protein